MKFEERDLTLFLKKDSISQHMKTYAINTTEILYEDFDGERVLLNLSEGTYYTLSPMGNTIWGWIEQGLSFESIVASIEGEHSDELLAFFESLLKERLIVETAEKGALPLSEKVVFTPPFLTVYEDMKELLLLDPIHEVDQLGWPHR